MGLDRADDADRLAAVGAAHERVPLGEGAPFEDVAIVLPPEGRPPPKAPADLTGLAAFAVPWPTAPHHCSVTRPSHLGPRRPAGRRMPGQGPAARRASQRLVPPQTADSPPRTPVAARAPPPPLMAPRWWWGGRTASEARPPRNLGAFPPAGARPPCLLSFSLSLHFRSSAARRR